MSQILKNSSNLCKAIKNINIRSSSTFSNSTKNPGRVTFISQSSDVFTNLAFETWLYNNWNFSKRHILLLWNNTPAVVIGRHQNPYIEANLDYLDIAGVPLARRNSGGGAVYHDQGNVNCTFFTPRERHDRLKNLELLCDALNLDFNIDARVNKKHDIVIRNDLKISGTAAKLGRLNAYHHCTLLVASDKQQLSMALSGDKSLQSKATVSVPSPVANIKDVVAEITAEQLISSIGKKYLESASGGFSSSDGFTLINPTEEWFPGINDLKNELKSWSWLYGMTPLFKTSRKISFCSDVGEECLLNVKLEVFRGIVRDITVDGKNSKDIQEKIRDNFVGFRYSMDIFQQIEDLFTDNNRPQMSVAH